MSTNSLIREERRLTLLAATMLAAMVLAVGLGKPGHGVFFPPCPLHALTGWLCPGCGSTRALWLLVHGQFLPAIRENALAVLSLPLVLFDLAAILNRRWPTLSSRIRPTGIWALLLVVILFAVLRNLPFAPFTLLAPIDLR